MKKFFQKFSPHFKSGKPVASRQWRILLLIFAALLGISSSFHIYLFLNLKKQAAAAAASEPQQFKGIQKKDMEEAIEYLKEKEAVFKETLEKPPQIFDPS